jgi:hypothetical protein
MNHRVGTGNGALDVGGRAGVATHKVAKRGDLGNRRHHVRHPDREACFGNELGDGLTRIAARTGDYDRHCHA